MLSNFAAPIPYYIVFIILHIRWSFEKTCICTFIMCIYYDVQKYKKYGN